MSCGGLKKCPTPEQRGKESRFRCLNNCCTTNLNEWQLHNHQWISLHHHNKLRLHNYSVPRLYDYKQSTIGAASTGSSAKTGSTTMTDADSTIFTSSDSTTTTSTGVHFGFEVPQTLSVFLNSVFTCLEMEKSKLFVSEQLIFK